MNKKDLSLENEKSEQNGSSGMRRRDILRSALALSAGAVMSRVGMAEEWEPSLRYPDPAIQVLDPSFMKYRLFNASVERLATGFRWLEGPVWFGDGRYLLVSDIANNRIVRWDEITGRADTWRTPSNYSNGNTRDRQGRLVTCEGAIGRRVTRTEYNGSITVLADNYQGKRFNSPNDVVCAADGSIWFTDPPFQLSNNYEGRIAEPELPHGVYRINASDGKVVQVLDNIAGPNGLCFSPDGKKFYLVEGRAKPNRLVWVFDVSADGQLSNKTKFIEAQNYAALDGIKCDIDGNLWAGWGSTGALEGKPEELDGVMVFNPSGQPIGHIHLPERCPNLCFGGENGNRLFMASSHSLYALYVNTQGAGLV